MPRYIDKINETYVRSKREIQPKDIKAVRAIFLAALAQGRFIVVTNKDLEL